MTSIVTIQWRVTRPDAAPQEGTIALSAEHVAAMFRKRPPDPMERAAELAHFRAVNRADDLSRMIAGQIAADILAACNPEKP